ncbi:unnamed protein product [Closterium sp. Naga37s-1]|nr:unnamed protein product [Closterium sp. Naga37s-1]CAI5521945.1 unnamed protein product [Closterium sp. Naga37s-1]
MCGGDCRLRVPSAEMEAIRPLIAPGGGLEGLRYVPALPSLSLPTFLSRSCFSVCLTSLPPSSICGDGGHPTGKGMDQEYQSFLNEINTGTRRLCISLQLLTSSLPLPSVPLSHSLPLSSPVVPQAITPSKYLKNG